MRINVELPLASTSSLASQPSSSVPPPLVQLAPSGELALIELQGRLEMDDVDASGGQVLAKLEFSAGREDRPTLLISHHRLEGKIVSLPRPLAVLEKKRRVKEDFQEAPLRRGRVQDVASSPTPFENRSDPLSRGGALEREDDDDDAAAPSSPTMTRKRARPNVEEVSLQTPLKRTRDAEVMSSSPMPPPPMRGSELDFSSPTTSPARRALPTHTDKEEEEGDSAKSRTTKTYFEVVCVIRKKILFTKRPEPVVRLDEEGGEKAKVALGIA
ncbi:hypothetical protein FA10DRAFT_263790 [Acaromyces ingoldii]|uniref:Ctf8-domain-containing protein n=1 Tax=Acaromyces ingoldii TaxID=215250 RepID=A0A316YUY0_9BASI|nr:hypothetical protein FA10DRAFT_263790 [Acaromyces ingoldii]PWN93089.1 hypothetical protein FA10DRAFT_263790 [Acaromyces ingoldii]